jgi:hypothetical protein
LPLGYGGLAAWRPDLVANLPLSQPPMVYVLMLASGVLMGFAAWKHARAYAAAHFLVLRAGPGNCSEFWGRVTHLRRVGDYRGEAVAAYLAAGATGSRRRTIACRAGGPRSSAIRGVGAGARSFGRGRGIDCAFGSPYARAGDAPWPAVFG